MRRKPVVKKFQPQLPRFDRNLYIKPEKLRVVTEEGENLGVISKSEALKIAQQRELDLILINPQAEPPVAKIIAWSKFKYELSKKKKSQKAKVSETKGMWIKPFIDEGDLNHKLSRIKEFLAKGDKVKIEVRPAKGRRSDRDKMQDTANKILERVAEFAESEGGAKWEGRNISVYLKSKK